MKVLLAISIEESAMLRLLNKNWCFVVFRIIRMLMFIIIPALFDKTWILEMEKQQYLSYLQHSLFIEIQDAEI